MVALTQIPFLDKKLRSNRGQSLIIALSVMFIMVMLGTIFVTLIAQNLRSAFRSGDVITARQMAEAGIRYADKMLTYSEDGADWRPAPTNLDPATNGDHPDIRWLQPYDPATAPTGGYTTYNSGNGRFLLRVSYNPDPNDPMSRYIKIEVVGRTGFVDAKDPTTLAQAGPIRLRQELTAYKPIGITDYARFVTNKNKRGDTFSFGRPLERYKDGDLAEYGKLIFGGMAAGERRSGPVRVNGNLRWKGQVEIDLRGIPSKGVEVLPVDRVEVAGDITHDDNTAVMVSRNGGAGAAVNPTRVNGIFTPTSDPADASGYTTLGGFYRDGIDSADREGRARAVKRLEPPLVDQEDPTSGTTRYRRVTRDSGAWARWGSQWVNVARYGYGQGLYIENRRDVQDEGSSIFGGGQTLRTEWTHPTNRGNWQGGAYYVPPGVVIHINPDASLTITRTDLTRGQKYVWYSYDSAAGTIAPMYGAGPTNTIPYPPNGVVFAEGNIRISGVVAPGRQLTVVSDQNIYIEGNLLKADPETSALSLLARKNVVVNTTQFFSLPPITTAGWESVVGGGEAPYAYSVTTSPASNFRALMSFGYLYTPADLRSPDDYPDWGHGKKLHLFLRHASAGAASSINLLINGEPYPFAPNVFNYLMADAATQFAPTFEGRVFPLAFGGGGPDLNSAPGAPNTLEIGLHQTGLEQSRGDYLLESIAVQPLDINIQALLYAQEGSFFIIPGPWFNSNPEDNSESYGMTSRRPAYIADGPDSPFPFFGQGLDVRITFDGAISENVPASDGDVQDWNLHWFNIPDQYGSSSEKTVHGGHDGGAHNLGWDVRFLYDSHLGFPVTPVSPASTAGRAPLRTDSFGRALPVTPKLPVSPDLIYVGRMTS